MVVDDVEDHADAQRVGAVDEPAEVVRRAVQARRREEVDAVVPPAEPPGELADGHDLEAVDAELGERRQLADRGLPGAFAA